MPPDTDADVLRRHGLHVLADWAENILIAPAYARQSQYWASVLSPPVIPDFAEWGMMDAREFEFEAEDEAELPDADLPLLTDIFVDLRHRRFLNTAKNSAPPAPLGMRPCRMYRAIYPSTGAHTDIDSG